jgi:hypothetical protein
LKKVLIMCYPKLLNSLEELSFAQLVMMPYETVLCIVGVFYNLIIHSGPIIWFYYNCDHCGFGSCLWAEEEREKERENPFSLSLRTLLWVVIQRNGHPGDIIDDLTSGSCMHGVTLVMLGLNVSKIHFSHGHEESHNWAIRSTFSHRKEWIPWEHCITRKVFWHQMISSLFCYAGCSKAGAFGFGQSKFLRPSCKLPEHCLSCAVWLFLSGCISFAAGPLCQSV